MSKYTFEELREYQDIPLIKLREYISNETFEGERCPKEENRISKTL